MSTAEKTYKKAIWRASSQQHLCLFTGRTSRRSLHVGLPASACGVKLVDF